jgi:hypothetical protein
MTQTVEQKLRSLGIELPAPTAPIANYVGFVRTGALLVVSPLPIVGGTGSPARALAIVPA